MIERYHFVLKSGCGLRRLHDISQTWKLSHQISPPIEPP
ncbi:Mobile element protein [Microcystis aeruginosa NIES-2549]|uniref:Mobile element protein n=1 Tax=Microcystis aeruginosa NIES-2549 TaxID=1641812 RepID=A0A0F6U1Z0_MICAE|nr:Mobile element protein [Microcystis aeruginosa NIES-2549]AOC51470.1 Mobile element protein [Microcystis aeruginosa NIES-2481]